MDIEELRSLFPHTENQIYLNHAATGPLSRPVVAAIDRYVEERHRTNVENYFDFLPVVEETIARCARLINAQVSCVEFTANTSTGVAILAEGLDWQPGDRVAVPGCEFPANVYPFMHLRDRGVEVDFIPHQEATFSLEDVERALRPQTRLVSVSWVQFLSGFRCDVEALVRLCHDRNILVCVDAIQGLGALRLDVEATGVDFIATGCHKWLMATQGIGFVYVAEHLQDRLRPRAGWLHGPVDWDNFFDYELAFHPDARRFRTGTFNSIGIAALHAALGLHFDCGPEWCEAQVLDRAVHLAASLDDVGASPYGRLTGGAPTSGIVAIKSAEPEQLFDTLTQSGIACSLRNGLIRFAPTYYNTEAELDRAAEVVGDHLQMLA